jgi:hypothetical protein
VDMGAVIKALQKLSHIGEHSCGAAGLVDIVMVWARIMRTGRKFYLNLPVGPHR